MARIRTTCRAERTHVRIAGKLTASDVGRLEHACRHALTSHPLRVQFELGEVTQIDASAAAFIEHLVRRGATIRNSGTRRAG